MDLETLQRLPGTQFPGGSYRIEPDDHARLLDVVMAPERPDGSAHPLYSFVATLRSMGWTPEDLLSACGSTMEDGPMVVGLRLSFERPLRVGTTYTVSGEILSVERKEGRRAGVFDLVVFELRMEADGQIAARVFNTWLLPRRDL